MIRQNESQRIRLDFRYIQYVFYQALQQFIITLYNIGEFMTSFRIFLITCENPTMAFNGVLIS